MNDQQPPAKFETGRTYTTRSACDHNCIFAWKIIKRTAKTITVTGHSEKNKRVKIHTDNDGNEWAMPAGVFSMCPVIQARK